MNSLNLHSLVLGGWGTEIQLLYQIPELTRDDIGNHLVTQVCTDISAVGILERPLPGQAFRHST